MGSPSLAGCEHTYISHQSSPLGTVEEVLGVGGGPRLPRASSSLPSRAISVPSCSFSRRVWQRTQRKAYAGDGGVVEKAAVYGKALKQEPCFIIT